MVPIGGNKMKNITRYYVWEEPIGVYPPRQLGYSEGYTTFEKARKQADDLLNLSHGGTNIWVLKAVTVYKKNKPFDDPDIPARHKKSLPRWEGFI